MLRYTCKTTCVYSTHIRYIYVYMHVYIQWNSSNLDTIVQNLRIVK